MFKFILIDTKKKTYQFRVRKNSIENIFNYR